MKLNYEDKIKIYELRQNGVSIKSLSKQFGIAASGLQYMIRLIDRYGIDIVKKHSSLSVSLDYAEPRNSFQLDSAIQEKRVYSLLVYF